ncbi:filamentous hemagglutinin N-terminal domain-containing protein [Terasakiella pusilla]|uniref:two-partner secretion domain-containing protein n=1 Tax=Terasakiella pusilla TaxID=64973 RepID=UPI003AA94836
MKIVKHFSKQALCWTLSLTIALQPNLVQAQQAVITVDPATPSVVVDRTLNDTPLLQIVKPNASGISHNKFIDFNVGSKGLVINNATTNTTTQIGGAILANPNFNGTAASLILNEVTSANRSSLTGFTEIAGQKADYILANPNGITCNGCGFINTSRSTLTTGTPTFNGTALDSLSVNGGDIIVNSLGLNAEESDAFDIITRAATLSGAINAKDLTIIAGRNDVKYADRSVTKKADDGSIKPTLAIDSSALGGMYAGRIALIANETGVGVNMQGEMAASTSNLTITADGRIDFKKASAKTDLTVTSQDTVKVTERAYAENDLKITAPTLDATGATVAAGNNVTLSGTTITATNAQVIAGLQSNGSSAAQGDVSVTATGTFKYDGGTIRAGQNVKLEANQVDGGASSSGITALGNATIKGTTAAALSGDIKVGGNLTLTGGALSTTSGSGDVTGTATINATSYSGTNGLKAGGNIDVTTTGDTALQTGGTLTSNGAVTINAQNITSDGTISSQTGTTLTATGTLTTTTNAKTQSAANTTLTSTGNMTLGGTTTATNELTVNAPNLTNNGVMADGTNDGLSINITGDLTNTGTIYSKGTLTLKTPGTLTNNEGAILADSDIWIDADGAGTKNTKVHNLSGQIESLNGGITIATNDLTNERKDLVETQDVISSSSSSTTTTEFLDANSGGGGYDITSTYRINNSSSVINVTTTSTTPIAKILSKGDMALSTTTLINKGGQISSNADLNMNGSSLSNTGAAAATVTSSSYSKYLIAARRCNEGSCSDGQYNTLISGSSSSSTVITAPGDTFITAGGNITGSFTGSIDNISIKNGVDPVTITQGSANVHATSADIGTPTTDSINAGLTLPTGSGGLFVQSTDPTSSYILETNPAVSTLGALYGSSYFEQKMGINLAAEVKRLGNDDYETRLVRDQIMAVTHQRFLSGSATNDSDQYKALMDAALAQKDDLQLSYGVALSKEQIAKLTGDLVWMVEVTLDDGRKALKPVVYFTQATRMAIDSSGALIVAQNGDLTLTAANDITNSGTLSGANTTLASSAGSITNAYGKLEASGGDLKVTADQNIANTGGLIAGNNVTLTATNGNITNTTQTWRQSQTLADNIGGVYGNTQAIEFNDTTGAKARISASNGNLTITAGKNITDSGQTTLSASNNASLSAGEDIQLLALSTQKRVLEREQRYEGTQTLTQTGTSLSAGNDLSLSAGGQAVLQGTKGQAGNDLKITSGSDTLILATQNQETVEKGTNGKGLLWSTEQTHNLASLKAGNDLTISSGLDTVVNGAALEGGHDVKITSLASTTLNSVQDSFEQNIKTKKYTLIVDKKDTVRTTVTAGNDVTLQATLGDVTLKAVDVKAGGKVELAALNGDVNLSANKDVNFRHEVKTTTGGMWTTITDQGRLDETVQHTTIDAGDGLTITVGTNGSINVDYKDFGDLDKSIDRLSKEPGLEWMAQVKAGLTDVQWNAVKEAHESWSTSNKSLSGAATIMITMIATVVTMGAGAMFAAGTSLANMSLGGLAAQGMGLTGTAMGAAVSAGINTLAVSSMVSTVANKGNPLAVMKDMASKENLRSLAAAMVTAGIMQGATNADILPKGGYADLSGADAIQKFAVQTTVRTAVNATINGQDLGDAAKQSITATATDMLASYTFDAIGGFAQNQTNDGNDLWKDGSPLKAVAHSVAGGFIAELSGQEFTAGAVSAAATELMSGALAEVDPNLRVHMAGMIGATAVMLTGGSAEDMQMGQTIAQSVMLNNHLMHPDFKKRMDDKFEEEKENYPGLTQDKLAKLQKACGESHCFDTLTGGLDTEALKVYAADNGYGSFGDEILNAFENLHDITADEYSTEVALANRSKAFEALLTGKVPESTQTILYIPDQNDIEAVNWVSKTLGDPNMALSEFDSNAYETALSQLEQSDPSLYQAVSYMHEKETIDTLILLSSVFPSEKLASFLLKSSTAVKLTKTQNLAKNVQNYLGNNYVTKTNKAGDKIFLSNDSTKRVRFDINNPHGDVPHMHIEELKPNGKWGDASDTHRIRFK